MRYQAYIQLRSCSKSVLRALSLSNPPPCQLRALCTPSTPAAPTGDSIMQMAANKATRFVYMRTLPLAKQPQLAHQVDALADAIESATEGLCRKHGPALTDARSAVHLHTAALAIATHRVLAPYVKDGTQLTNIIRAAFGAAPIPRPGEQGGDSGDAQGEERKKPDYWIVRAALWFSFDKMRAVRSMTKNMVSDFGESFETGVVEEEVGEKPRHTLFVKKCFYDEICREEGLPHLTKVFCALDRAIYSPITEQSHGIEFKLVSTLADEPPSAESPSQCEFRFTKTS